MKTASKAKVVKSFVVKRSRWLRGKGPENSCLYDAINKKMCCLGFLARECGLSIKDIRDVGSPAGTGKESFYDRAPYLFSGKFIGSIIGQSGTCTDAMRVNDDTSLSDKERESQLKAIFKEAGVKLKFIK